MFTDSTQWDRVCTFSADKLNELGQVSLFAKKLHALPGRRRQLSVDTISIANACWSVGPLDHGKRNHTWDLQPCPWIVNIWQLGALAASSMDMVIPCVADSPRFVLPACPHF